MINYIIKDCPTVIEDIIKEYILPSPEMVQYENNIKWLNLVGNGYEKYKNCDGYHHHNFSFPQYFFGLYDVIPEMKNDEIFIK